MNLSRGGILKKFCELDPAGRNLAPGGKTCTEPVSMAAAIVNASLRLFGLNVIICGCFSPAPTDRQTSPAPSDWLVSQGRWHASVSRVVQEQHQCFRRRFSIFLVSKSRRTLRADCCCLGP